MIRLSYGLVFCAQMINEYLKQVNKRHHDVNKQSERVRFDEWDYHRICNANAYSTS